MTKVLFVCSRNEIRSLTAERLLAGTPGYQARSAGTQEQARIRVTPGLLGWADLIFVMERSHERRLQERFPEELAGRSLICLHLPDDYEYMEDALVEELESRLAPHLPGWRD